MIRVDRRPPSHPSPAGLWLASAACEAVLALTAGGVLFATYHLLTR